MISVCMTLVFCTCPHACKLHLQCMELTLYGLFEGTTTAAKVAAGSPRRVTWTTSWSVTWRLCFHCSRSPGHTAVTVVGVFVAGGGTGPFLLPSSYLILP